MAGTLETQYKPTVVTMGYGGALEKERTRIFSTVTLTTIAFRVFSATFPLPVFPCRRHFHFLCFFFMLSYAGGTVGLYSLQQIRKSIHPMIGVYPLCSVYLQPALTS